MAFHLKSKFTSNGFITNVKTGASPLLQVECLQYGVVNGERKCIKQSKTVSGNSVPFSSDPNEKEKQLQWIKDNPEKYKEMLDAKNTTLTRSRDITSGETTSEEELATRKLRQKAMRMYKRTKGKYAISPRIYDKWLIENNLPLTIKEDFQASIDRRANKEKKKKEDQEFCRRYPKKCSKKPKTSPSNKPGNTTITTTDDTLGEYSEYK
jgi:hypothetical protein|tara:strand:- start:168 stop:794 length:627 start_codon:yes stop_codon:yes gene_type:complete